MIEMASVVAVQDERPARRARPRGELLLGDPAVAHAVERHDGYGQPGLAQRRDTLDGGGIPPDEIEVVAPPMRPLPYFGSRVGVRHRGGELGVGELVMHAPDRRQLRPAPTRYDQAF